MVEVRAIVRDVALVWALTFAGGLGVGAAGPRLAGSPSLVVAVNLVLGTAAFTVSGCLAAAPRLRHLAFVALAAWASGLVNVVLLGTPVRVWFGTIVYLTVVMIAGAVLSSVLVHWGRRTS